MKKLSNLIKNNDYIIDLFFLYPEILIYIFYGDINMTLAISISDNNTKNEDKIRQIIIKKIRNILTNINLTTQEKINLLYEIKILKLC